MCGHALKLGLARLAEGEEPIKPEEELDYWREREAGGAEEPAPDEELPPLNDHPAAIERHPPQPEVGRKRGVVISELWFSYSPDVSSVVVHETELDALRYAVANDAKVRRLELGRPIADQVADAG
jgi:hypothetical protein